MGEDRAMTPTAKEANGTKRSLLVTRVAVAVLIPLIAVAIAWGSLRQDVQSHHAELETKADASVVALQNTQTRNDIREIKAALLRIEEKLDER